MCTKARIFLSRASDDGAIAKVIAETLTKLSNGNVKVWFSSDMSGPGGGLSPGAVWLDEIRTQIEQSHAIIVLLTPLSLEKPSWLTFEAGYASAIPNCKVILVCVGLDKKTIPFPLAMYQCYQLAGFESLQQFVYLVLSHHEIPFGEKSAKPELQRSIARLTRAMDPPTKIKLKHEIRNFHWSKSTLTVISWT